MKEPRVEDGRRVLGVVPGTPPGGERKDPAEQDLVMVWPHLLVRHAVVALLVVLVVLVLALVFDAPLRDVPIPSRHRIRRRRRGISRLFRNCWLTSIRWWRGS